MKYNDELLKKIIGDNKGTEREVEIPFLLEKLPEPNENKKILDVGCAYSNIIYALDEVGFDIHGIDMLECNPPVKKFHLGDARNMPYSDNEFDYVICISSLEHFGKVETPYHTDKVEDQNADIKAMKEMIRVVKPQGQVILTLPVGYAQTHWYQWVNFYNGYALQRLLEGLKILDIKYSFKDGDTWKRTTHFIAENVYSEKIIMANVSLLLGKI